MLAELKALKVGAGFFSGHIYVWWQAFPLLSLETKWSIVQGKREWEKERKEKIRTSFAQSFRRAQHIRAITPRVVMKGK